MVGRPDDPHPDGLKAPPLWKEPHFHPSWITALSLSLSLLALYHPCVSLTAHTGALTDAQGSGGWSEWSPDWCSSHKTSVRILPRCLCWCICLWRPDVGRPSARVPAWPVWGPTLEGSCASSLIYVLAPTATKHCLTSHLSPRRPLKPPTAADRLKMSGKMWLFTNLGHIKVWPGSFIVSRGWFPYKRPCCSTTSGKQVANGKLKKKKEFLVKANKQKSWKTR